jgi:hypothetical protein
MAKPPFRFVPVVPKRRVGPNVSRGKVLGLLNHWATAVISTQTQYPSPPAGSKYRRTGEYGRRWTRRTGFVGQFFGVQVGSNLDYAARVGGFKTRKPRQTKLMRRIGWTSVEVVGRLEWIRVKPKLLRALAGR